MIADTPQKVVVRLAVAFAGIVEGSRVLGDELYGRRPHSVIVCIFFRFQYASADMHAA
jgi:hypothetical protein